MVLLMVSFSFSEYLLSVYCMPDHCSRICRYRNNQNSNRCHLHEAYTPGLRQTISKHTKHLQYNKRGAKFYEEKRRKNRTEMTGSGGRRSTYFSTPISLTVSLSYPSLKSRWRLAVCQTNQVLSLLLTVFWWLFLELRKSVFFSLTCNFSFYFKSQL